MGPEIWLPLFLLEEQRRLKEREDDDNFISSPMNVTTRDMIEIIGIGIILPGGIMFGSLLFLIPNFGEMIRDCALDFIQGVEYACSSPSLQLAGIAAVLLVVCLICFTVVIDKK